MGEMIEYWQQQKREIKEKRRATLEKAEDRWGEFAYAAERGGYYLVNSTPAHWPVKRIRNDKVVAQYWPSANKWQSAKTGKIKRGSPEKFIELLERGVF
jgi:hypothetical protein